MQKEYPTIKNNEIDKSTHISNLSFSNRKDYVSYLQSHGMVQADQDPMDNDHLVVAIQRHWHTRGQNGCVFAQVAATHADKLGWNSEVLRLGESDEKISIGKRIDQAFEKATDNKTNQNLSLLFPDIVTPQQITKLLKEIRDTSKKIKVLDSDFEDFKVLALRGELNDNVLSWIVGFGPFDFLPLTRQAPITEIAIRTKKKPEVIFQKLNQDREAAHLADIQLGLSDEMMDTLFISTKSRTEEILAGTSRKLSSAKVSFSIPKTYWDN